MKPHEETWTAAQAWEMETVPWELHIGGEEIAYGLTPERARLAAQAPAMARLLLAYLEQGDTEEKDKLAAIVLRDAGVLP